MAKRSAQTARAQKRVARSKKKAKAANIQRQRRASEANDAFHADLLADYELAQYVNTFANRLPHPSKMDECLDILIADIKANSDEYSDEEALGMAEILWVIHCKKQDYDPKETYLDAV
jgi:hypothetical protein